MKKLIVLFILLFLLICASAWAYEFHLKNGAVIKGDLIAYRGGLFKLRVKNKGAVIIIGESDVNFIKPDVEKKSALTHTFEVTDSNPDDWPVDQVHPSALKSHSLPPALEHHSLLPHPVKGFAAITSLSHFKKGFKGYDK